MIIVALEIMFTRYARKSRRSWRHGTFEPPQGEARCKVDSLSCSTPKLSGLDREGLDKELSYDETALIVLISFIENSHVYILVRPEWLPLERRPQLRRQLQLETVASSLPHSLSSQPFPFQYSSSLRMCIACLHSGRCSKAYRARLR